MKNKCVKTAANVFLTLFMAVLVIPASVSAHELIPPAVLDYIEEHPNATPAEIDEYFAANPSAGVKNTASGQALLEAAQANKGLAETIFDFLTLGVGHVLSGLDHVLFIFLIILAAATLGRLLWYATAFTIAHSITLILTALGVISISARITEPIIALSILYLAVSGVVLAKKGIESKKKNEVITIFLFGLFHGLGFAGIIAEVGIPKNNLIPALLAFNGGVEIAQLLIVAAVFPFVYLGRKKAWYPMVVNVLRIITAVLALFWVVERLMAP